MGRLKSLIGLNNCPLMVNVSLEKDFNAGVGKKKTHLQLRWASQESEEQNFGPEVLE